MDLLPKALPAGARIHCGLSNAGLKPLELKQRGGFANTISRFPQPQFALVMSMRKSNLQLRASNSFRAFCFPRHGALCVGTSPSLPLSWRAYASFKMKHRSWSQLWSAAAKTFWIAVRLPEEKLRPSRIAIPVRILRLSIFIYTVHGYSENCYAGMIT